MLKERQITRNDIQGFTLKIGYCGIQNLLRYEKRTGYNSGVYGWNYDLYEINGVSISTGYRPIGQSVNYEIVRKYEEQARAINQNYNLTYEEQKEQVKKLLNNFVMELIENYR